MEILIWRANAFWNGNFNLTSILECNSWKSVTIFPKIQWWHVHFVLDYEDPHPRSWKLVDLITSMKRKEYAPLRWNWLQAYKNQILNIFLKQDRYALATWVRLLRHITFGGIMSPSLLHMWNWFYLVCLTIPVHSYIRKDHLRLLSSKEVH